MNSPPPERCPGVIVGGSLWREDRQALDQELVIDALTGMAQDNGWLFGGVASAVDNLDALPGDPQQRTARVPEPSVTATTRRRRQTLRRRRGRRHRQQLPHPDSMATYLTIEYDCGYAATVSVALQEQILIAHTPLEDAVRNLTDGAHREQCNICFEDNP